MRKVIMNNLHDLMEIRFIGKDLFPETIRAKELADIISNTEDSLTNIIVKENPNISLDNLIIGLVSIEEGSAKLRFKSSIQVVALSAFTLLSASLANNDFTKLPSASINSLKNISDFTKRRNCVAEFRSHADSEIPLASITPSTEIIIPESYYLEGETILYGRVERVGGVKPKIVLRITDNQTVHCDASEALAKEIGRKLYSWVGLLGKAKWNTEDYLLDSFKIEKVTEYQDTPLLKGTTELSSMVGKYLKDKIDVIKIVSDLRG
jgi:hypothetical protein